ncbi:hypothetical protein EJB05_40839, partial [Eragrostis curvula]
MDGSCGSRRRMDGEQGRTRSLRCHGKEGLFAGRAAAADRRESPPPRAPRHRPSPNKTRRGAGAGVVIPHPRRCHGPGGQPRIDATHHGREREEDKQQPLGSKQRVSEPACALPSARWRASTTPPPSPTSTARSSHWKFGIYLHRHHQKKSPLLTSNSTNTGAEHGFSPVLASAINIDESTWQTIPEDSDALLCSLLCCLVISEGCSRSDRVVVQSENCELVLSRESEANGFQSGTQEVNSARTLSQSTHDNTTHRTPSHRITGADKSRGRAAASGTGAQCVELKQCSYSYLACRLHFYQDLLSSSSSSSSPLHGCLVKSSSTPWPYQPGRALVDDKNEPAGEGLPDGWMKECRPRKNRHGSRMKGDTFYIDPIHGYEFRSLKDVYRYLQSGDISQCVRLPIKRKIEDLHGAGDQSLHTGRSLDCTHLDQVNELNQYEVGLTEPLRDAWLSPDSGSSKANNINSIQGGSDQVEASEVRGNQSGSEEHTPVEAESVTRKGSNVEQKTKERKRKMKSVKQMATPLRSSPRLAALKMSQEAKDASRDGCMSTQTDITNQLQPKQVKNPRRKANSSVLPEKKDGAPGSSEKIEDNYCLVPSQIRASAPCPSSDVGCQNALVGVPVPQQQVGSTADGMPGSALSSLFLHVWSDPCLQFAFRTLTGDIPVLNDTLAAANYFLPHQTLNKGTTPNFSSSAYDGTINHAQVNHVGLSMPRQSENLYNSGWFPPQ